MSVALSQHAKDMAVSEAVATLKQPEAEAVKTPRKMQHSVLTIIASAESPKDRANLNFDQY